ncbi:MAG: hypothetical protein BXU00_03095 [Candidatus Nanoclepta minutus]|uniref:protein-serine/threonine phosphatase n=1 Tax=Candidatus Nanoclepta minutus TaxID=1940235 RepID=A0A397WMA0_9ARCH|nr:MAG: hypothetical protein BXU00_03095 [Candidatus Nanoclepta minutus]
MEGLIRILEEVEPLLRKGSSNFTFNKGLAKIVTKGRCIVIGDVHGDLETLNKIFETIDLNSFLKDEDNIVIFLGDYVDRGKYSLEVLEKIFRLKLEYQNQILLLRGNHEISKYWDVYPSDFRYQLLEKFRDNYNEIYDRLIDLFDRLPIAAYYEDFLFLVHGGIPIDVKDINEIANEEPNTVIQLVWNDPFEGIGHLPSPRGIGYLFGIDITMSFLRENGLDLIIRGHEPCEGIKFNHNRKVITVFSSKVYGNEYASVLFIDLGKRGIREVLF